jgi:hypothetical protein
MSQPNTFSLSPSESDPVRTEEVVTSTNSWIALFCGAKALQNPIRSCQGQAIESYYAPTPSRAAGLYISAQKPFPPFLWCAKIYSSCTPFWLILCPLCIYFTLLT